MSMRMGRGAWGQGNTIRSIYRYDDHTHKRRMGCCDWLPSDGDLCVCISHTGDCFNDYFAVRKQEDGKYKIVGKFGAYVFGRDIGTLTERDFHLLLAGESIDCPIFES